MDRDLAAEVLLVDRDPEVGRRLAAFLSDRGYDVEWVDDSEKAFNRLDSRAFDVLVSELNLPRVNGMRLMQVARERNAEICVVFIAEPSDTELATEAMREGAHDFQNKPVNLEKLNAVIQRGIQFQQLVFQQYELKRRLDERFGLANLVGKSRPMVQVYNTVRQVAPSQSPVLIEGEPGTGKDLIAQAIHNNSARRDEPFVKLNCARISQAMVESELFGHTAGAFAGATQNRRGRFELADRGTLYLDEIGALEPALQLKVLQALEQETFTRVGDDRSLNASVRVVASSNRSLHDLVLHEGFNRALYDRLATVIVQAPALRARREDVPLLTTHFLGEANKESGRNVDGITRSAMDVLMRYNWPGNVRELRNIVEGAVAVARHNAPLDTNDLPDHILRATAPEVGEIRIPTGLTMADVERIVIQETLKVSGYNKEKCAKILDIGLRTLYRKLQEFNMR